MDGWVKCREGLPLEHYRLLDNREYALFSALLPLMVRVGKNAGRVGTRKWIAERIGGRGWTINRAIAELAHRKYLRVDEAGVVWVLNPHGGKSQVTK